MSVLSSTKPRATRAISSIWSIPFISGSSQSGDNGANAREVQDTAVKAAPYPATAGIVPIRA